MSDAQADKVLDGVRGWLQRQGYALEYETAARFAQNGYKSRQGLTYRDGQTGKTREIDVVAETQLDSLVKVLVVIECKSSREPWIVRKTRLDSEQRAGWALSEGFTAVRIAGHATLGLFTGPDPTGIAVVQKDAKPSDRNPADDAILQVVSAAQGVAQARQAVGTICHPAVVFDGDLVSLWYDDVGRERLEKTPWERVIWSGGPGLEQPVAVDVVTRAHVPGYARVLLGQIVEAQQFLGSIIQAIAGGPPPSEAE